MFDRNRISISSDGFAFGKKHREKKAKWSEVDKIYSVSLDKVTYEESFLIFLLGNGDEISIGEMDDGFSVFENVIAESLPNFPVDWRKVCDENPEAEPVLLWERGSN